MPAQHPAARWAAKFAATNADQVGALRNLPGVCVWSNETEVWAIGCFDSQANDVRQLLRSLPCDWLDLLNDKLLVPPGNQVPVAELPADSTAWVPIDDWLELSLPTPQVARGSVNRVPVRLVRSSKSIEARAMLSTVAAFQKYADTAPEFRLAPLTFAVNQHQDVFIRGTPLPSLPGQPFAESASIAWPAGYEWTPRVSALTIRDLFEIPDSTLLILHVDGSWESIDESAWSPARRSAIRDS